jgi:hypothetical protein
MSLSKALLCRTQITLTSVQQNRLRVGRDRGLGGLLFQAEQHAAAHRNSDVISASDEQGSEQDMHACDLSTHRLIASYGPRSSNARAACENLYSAQPSYVAHYDACWRAHEM